MVLTRLEALKMVRRRRRRASTGAQQPESQQRHHMTVRKELALATKAAQKKRRAQKDRERYARQLGEPESYKHGFLANNPPRL